MRSTVTPTGLALHVAQIKVPQSGVAEGVREISAPRPHRLMLMIDRRIQCEGEMMNLVADKLQGCCQRKSFGSGFAPLLLRFSGSGHQSSKKTQGDTRPPSYPAIGPTTN
jgi:hypothetical protein